jgi:cell cycle sensor histidine kinase DivJ
MTQSSTVQPDFAGPAIDTAGALRWHAGWAGALALEAVVLLFGAHAPAVLILALLIGSSPALGALALAPSRRRGAGMVLLIWWALAAALAAGLSGGLTGPLAAWCLTPLAAACVLGGSRTLAQGAALSVLAVALVAVAQALGLTEASFAGPMMFSLGLFGLASALCALAIGLMIERRRLTQRIETQTANRDALEALLEAQPDLIFWIDGEGRIDATFGPAPADLSIERLKRLGLTSLAGPADQGDVRQALADAAERRRGALVFPLAGAEGVWLSLELRHAAGSGLVGVLRDVTVERERERDLERARQDAESLNVGKSRFLANMSHELRTPLNAIMGFSDIMRARLFGSLPGKYAEYADLIHDAGSHLLDLISDVLDMSKIEAARYDLRIETLDSREPVSAALRLMRLQADDVGVKLRGVLPSDALEAEGDRRAIKQIALNLISNALKFTPRGGVVTVSLGAIGGALELSVIDTGVGIAAGDLDRLGRPYEQAGEPSHKALGTGLGLSLVRAFAELHGGEMAIESRLGEGTTVTVRMPILAGQSAVAPDFHPVAADPRLLVEPELAEASVGGKVIPFKPQR